MLAIFLQSENSDAQTVIFIILKSLKLPVNWSFTQTYYAGFVIVKNSFDIHEVIEMALSDHTSFRDIERFDGLSADDVKRIMRQNLKRKL